MRDYSKFVKYISEGYSISRAARKSGIHISVIYNLLRDGRECEDSPFRSFYLAVENAKRVFFEKIVRSVEKGNTINYASRYYLKDYPYILKEIHKWADHSHEYHDLYLRLCEVRQIPPLGLFHKK